MTGCRDCDGTGVVVTPPNTYTGELGTVELCECVDGGEEDDQPG